MISIPDMVTPWPLVGRDRELASFGTAWAARHCHGVMICGPAGIGKTRLAEECLASATQARVVGGRATASAAAAAVPLGAIAHLIPPGLDLSDPVRGFAAVARALSEAGGGRKRVLLVDDLQWLDTASAILLRQLLDAGVIRLIGTVRTGEPVGSAVAALCGGDAIHRIDLSAFDVGQTELALRAALGGPVVRNTVQDLHTRSGGNILFLRELVLAALAAGSLADDGEIWELTGGPTAGTPRLSEMIGARLAAAPRGARTVLELLALCEPLPLADVEAAGDLDALAALEESGLVQVRTDGRRTTVALAHPLYGESLREDAPLVRRRMLLLGQIERTLATGARRSDDTRRIAAWQLTVTGTADPSLLIEAAATARYAHDYAQARTLLEALREEDQTAATRLMLGEVLFELGDPVAAEAVLAMAAAEPGDDPGTLAVALTRTLNLFWHAARTEEALALAEKAQAEIADPEFRKMLRHHEASMRLASGDPAALALLDDMPLDARDAADPAAWLSAALMKPVGLSMAGRAVEGLDWAERAYKAHLEVADRALYPHPASHLISVSMTLRDVGRLAEARAAGERAYAELAIAAAPLPRTWVALCVGQAEWLSGHPASARRWFAEAVRQARTHGHIRPLNPGLNGLAMAAALLGDVAVAGQAAAEARRHPPMGVYGEVDALSGAWLLAARGDLAGARALLAEAADRARATGNLVMESWLLIDLARLGAAARAAARLAEIASVSQGQLAPAAAGLARALSAGDPEQLLASSHALAGLGADLYAAEAASAAAAALQRDGLPRQAQAAACRAQQLAALCEGARTPLSGARAAAPLTKRQQEIAVLAAAGTTSKDIAERLQLSVRTVENHLQSAYAKLGVTTRAGLADALGPGHRAGFEYRLLKRASARRGGVAGTPHELTHPARSIMSKAAAYRIAPNVWRIPAARFDFVNIFALVDDDGQVTLVDTGFRSGAERAEAGLAAMGKALNDVTRIVLTHAHGDHAGSAARLSGVTGAGVAISEIDAPFARQGVAPPRDPATLSGRLLTKMSKPGKDYPAVIIGEEFADGDVLPVAGGLRVVHTPGHTPGHVALLHEDTGTLITGDSIWNVRKLSWGVKAFCADIKLNQQTADVLGELDYQVAAFTHGPHIAERARERVRTYLKDAERA